MNTRGSSSMAVMIRHFFAGLFRPSFLDDAGEASFTRAILGALAATVTFGLALVRLVAGASLGATHATGDVYAWTVAADRLLMICLPMFVLSLVTALVGPSVFPSEVDFWTLMPLPLARRSMFVAKATAVFAFATIFILGTNLAITLPLALLIGGAPGGRIGATLLAQLATSVVASAFAVIALVALHGTIMACAPRGRLRAATTVTQTTLICLLVLAIPLVAHVPALGPLLRERPGWLIWLPPVWFLGLEQWMLGSRDPFFLHLALASGAGSLAVVIAAVVGDLAAYRRFDCAVIKGPSTPAWTRWEGRRRRLFSRHPVHEGVRLFIGATLRRSGVHQVAWLGMCAVGIALATNTLIRAIGLRERWVIQAALETPFTLIAASVVGLRAALLVPATIRAGWIFRMTESVATRGYQLDAVVRYLFILGVLVPGAIAVPVVGAVVGLRVALGLFPLVVVMGTVFLEVVLRDWRRVPFTCTFLFAKRPLAYTCCLAVGIFGWLVFIGAGVLDVARSSVAGWILVALPMVAVLGGLRWHRRQTWGMAPLEFEDYEADGLDTLRLS